MVARARPERVAALPHRSRAPARARRRLGSGAVVAPSRCPMTTAPQLVRRRLDYVLIPALILGVVNSIVLSLPEGLGVPVAPDSPWPPLRHLHAWAVEQEPQHLVMPPTLQASLLYDG